MLLERNLNGVQHLGIPVADIEKTKTWYAHTLGFKVLDEPVLRTDEGNIRVAFLALGDMVIEFYQLLGQSHEAVKRRHHGHIDHLAIDVVDIDEALADALGRGAEFDESTPAGPVSLRDFGAHGVRYVFLRGPDGEKVELNQQMGRSLGQCSVDLRGWSHLGIPVANLEQSTAFYGRFGFNVALTATIPAGERALKIAMLEKDSFVVEVYQPLDADLVEIKTRDDGHIDHIALVHGGAIRARDRVK
jgi:lactoylglutathione lyase